MRIAFSPRRCFAAIAAAALLVPAASAERPARASSGLAFAITLTDGGRSISNDRFSLRVPGVKGAIAVEIEGWSLAGGRFSAPLLLENRTDADLYALRVDYVSTSSTKSPSAGGAPGVDRRGLAAPLTWDSLAHGARSTSLPFVAPDVVFADGATLVTLLGAVSGVASIGPIAVEGEAARDAIHLELDASGTLVLSDAAGKIVRIGPGGRGSARGAPSLPAPSACASRAAAGARACRAAPDDPGRVWVLASDGEELSELDAAGSVVRLLRLPGGPILDLAPGKEGRIYLLRRGGTIGVLRSF